MKGSKKQKFIQELKKCYEPPKPERKQEFLAAIRPLEEWSVGEVTVPTMGIGHMLATQLTYISKWVWCLSIIIFLTIVYVSQCMEADMRWATCACIPFFGMITVTESFRSMAFGMEELEMASRFSLRNVMIARIGILGLGNLLLLLVLAVLTEGAKGRNVLIFLFPYLLTSFGCLVVMRRFRGREGIYTGVGITIFVSCLEMIIYGNFPWIMEVQYTGWWLLTVGIFLVLTIREGWCVIERTEEWAWS